MAIPTKAPNTRRKATNLSLDQAMIAEAKELGLNISRIAEVGLTRAIAARKGELWLAENLVAIEGNNRYFAEHGLPFAEFRSC